MIIVVTTRYLDLRFYILTVDGPYIILTVDGPYIILTVDWSYIILTVDGPYIICTIILGVISRHHSGHCDTRIPPHTLAL